MEILPTETTWSNLLKEVNELDKDLGHIHVSVLDFSWLYQQYFKKLYVINNLGDNFFHCETCATFKDLLQNTHKGHCGSLGHLEG